MNSLSQTTCLDSSLPFIQELFPATDSVDSPSVTGFSSFQERLMAKGKVALDALMEKLTVEEKDVWLSAISKVSPVWVEDIVKNICEGEYQNVEGLTDFETSHLEDAVLAALLQEKITLAQCCSFLLFRSFMVGNLQKENVEQIALFTHEGTPNPQAYHLLFSTFLNIRKGAQEGDCLEEKDLVGFYDQIKEMPFSEQCFFVIPDTHSKEEMSIFEAVQEVGFNLCGGINEARGFSRRMIPSLSMMQLLVSCLYPTDVSMGDRLQMIPSFGPWTAEDILEGLSQNTRVFSLYSVRFPTPPKADGFIAGPTGPSRGQKEICPFGDFSWHDFYHAMRVAKIPPHLRQMLSTTATLLQEKQKEDSCVQGIYETLLDAEISRDVFQGQEQRVDKLFWYVLIFNIIPVALVSFLTKRSDTFEEISKKTERKEACGIKELEEMALAPNDPLLAFRNEGLKQTRNFLYEFQIAIHRVAEIFWKHHEKLEQLGLTPSGINEVHEQFKEKTREHALLFYIDGSYEFVKYYEQLEDQSKLPSKGFESKKA